MHKFLQFLAKKSIFLFGVALAILANPTIYAVLESMIFFPRSVNNPNAGFDTHDQFIQTMIFVSVLGFIIALVSRIAAWILAFQKMKSRKA